MDQMIRAGSPNLRKARCIVAIDKSEYIIGVVIGDDHALLLTDCASDGGEDLREDLAALCFWQCIIFAAAEEWTLASARFNIILRLVNDRNSFQIGGFGGIAPGHEAMFFHQHKFCVR